MYLIVIAWLYVTVMMAIAEAASPQGSVLGAIITFSLYGLLPIGILVYILGTPERKRRLQQRSQAEQQAWEQAQRTANSQPPDASSHASGAPLERSISAVREEQRSIADRAP